MCLLIYKIFLIHILGINRFGEWIIFFNHFYIFERVLFKLTYFEPPVNIFKTVPSSCLWLSVCLSAFCLETAYILIPVFQTMWPLAPTLIFAIQLHWDLPDDLTPLTHFSASVVPFPTSDFQPGVRFGGPNTILRSFFPFILFHDLSGNALCPTSSLVGSTSFYFPVFTVESNDLLGPHGRRTEMKEMWSKPSHMVGIQSSPREGTSHGL